MIILEDIRRYFVSFIAWIRRTPKNRRILYCVFAVTALLIYSIDAYRKQLNGFEMMLSVGVRFIGIHLFLLIAYGFYRYIVWAKSELTSEEAKINTMRKDTMNAIAHEIRTPLAAILGYTENIRLGICENKNDHYLDQIQNKAMEINKMIDEILSLSKLEDKDFSLKPEMISVNELIREMTEGNGIFEIRKNGEWTIDADREYIERMLKFLLDNAQRYRSDDTPVIITINHFSLKIHNACEPLSEEVLKHIFEFHPKKDGHYSFGLYYCHKAAEKNGLNIRIYNETDGVTVSLY